MATPWTHNYAALNGSLLLTALVVAIPIFFLFWALAVKRMKGHVAGVLTLLITIVICILVYRMPVTAALSAAVLGMVNGLFPIGWIILTAVFLFNLTVASGQFEVIKSSISALSPDRRIQALLIAFCFSAFMEGVAGQGAPVAVAAAMLIGLGFPALPAAVICLVANTPPVPFGPVGVPTIMMATVTGFPANTLTRAIGLDMAFTALIIPFFMVVVMVGFKRAREVWPAALVAGVSYAIASFLVTTYVGPELPAITASIVSIAVNPLLFRFRAPLETWLSGNRLLFRWISSRAAKPSSSEESALSGSPGHAVIVGYGPVGRTVADLLTRNGVSVTVIEMNLDTVHALRKRGIPAIYGDASHRPVIEATGIERAASFIVTAPGREAAEAIRLVRESGGAVRILARAAYVQEKSALRKAGADHVFTGEEEVALAMADYVLRDLGATPEQIEGERERLRATTVEETAGRN